jgi:Sap, sulfolipid-1-addressing protein
VLIQATGLALLAALSPTALLVAAVYLGSARPRLTGAFYLAGALIMSIVMGVLVLVVLRNSGLSHPRQHTPRSGLRLGLGVVMLAAGIVLATRKPKMPDPEKARQGIVSRMVASPAPLSAFAVGILLFAPGVTFIAALQVIATARASLELTVMAVTIVITINVLLVWLPLVLHLVAPGLTTRHLTAFNVWLRAHGSVILVGVLLVAGGIMVFDGIYGLFIRG